jgi:fructose-bisphosphate aldolase class II
MNTNNPGNLERQTYDPRAYLAVAEAAMAERVKRAVSELRGTGQTHFSA